MPRIPHIKKLDYYGVVDTGTTEPTGAELGQLFYNTVDSELKIYISNAWVTIGAGGGVDGTFDFMDGIDLFFMDGVRASFMSG